MTRLAIHPMTLREANSFVSQHHRHHGPVRGCICVLSAAVEGSESPCGVAIVGRPVSRMLQDGYTCEITRLCTDGTANAASMLLGRAWRAAKQLGYRRMVTYTLPEESGSSLKAAGFKMIGEAGGGSWSRTGRPRVDMHPLQAKIRWEKVS